MRDDAGCEPLVLVSFECGELAGPNPEVLCGEAGRVVRAVALRGVEVSVVFVDDIKMRMLNRTYRGVDRSTDVLAFPQLEEDSGLEDECEDRTRLRNCSQQEIGLESSPILLGDVVLSLPTACRQAELRGCEAVAEVRRLLIHGILHLIGYDHGTPSQASAMRVEEDRILRLVEQWDRDANLD